MRTIDVNNSNAIRLLKEGDEAMFDSFYLHYYSKLCAFASQYVELVESEELVQDVMLWLWENRQALIPELSVKSLLFTMVKNKCLNRIEHRKIKEEVHEKFREKFRQQFEDPDFYEREELMQLLSDAIRRLPEEYRQAFEWNRFKNLTYNEIAELTGVSPKTIAYRITQALKILRIELKDYLPLLLWIIIH
ncbi:RNA polymerase sigma-70 factor [Parabacteroides sp. Marseille-P3160]|uniref:RNA polymerase sigma-70 factor n=1 Tax=Parabacteroides sp. Marseille-P3160 TaxID=1917887 RepID=UPI0009BAAA8D|nr:RNA polymerase sigma-70 factor [Parabacteroides sp. Marseille-P3160]